MLVSLALSTGCSDADAVSSPTRALTTVDVTLESSSIEVGQFTSASAVALDQYAEPIPATERHFASNNPEVAGISPTTGKIFAIAPGTAEIFATIDGRSGQRTITVHTAARDQDQRSPIEWRRAGRLGRDCSILRTFEVDVSGWTLTDKDVFHTVLLPAGTRIPAHCYRIIDESMFPVGLGAVDGVHLFSRYGVQVDAYAWTSTPATSFGRCPDGSGDFVVTSAITQRRQRTRARRPPQNDIRSDSRVRRRPRH